MTLGERFVFIRKSQSPKMNQTDFAKSLGMSRPAYAMYEIDRVTPSDSIIELVCMKYKVNPEWLRNGEGDPWDKREGDLSVELRDILNGEDPFFVSVMTSLASMPPEWWNKFKDVLFEELDKQKKSGRG